ncbi:hypothetical protein [Thalassolituus maritimus]|uniref:Uncharacterized protein n=1 Tax=Thalassolituus maritimus TaxID=484498 RepID=A0ABQ0A339_9GAMM
MNLKSVLNGILPVGDIMFSFSPEVLKEMRARVGCFSWSFQYSIISELVSEDIIAFPLHYKGYSDSGFAFEVSSGFIKSKEDYFYLPINERGTFYIIYRDDFKFVMIMSIYNYTILLFDECFDYIADKELVSIFYDDVDGWMDVYRDRILKDINLYVKFGVMVEGY